MVGFAACGDDNEDGGGEAGGGKNAPVTLDVSVLAVTELAPFHIGLQRGWPSTRPAIPIAAWRPITSWQTTREPGYPLLATSNLYRTRGLHEALEPAA